MKGITKILLVFSIFFLFIFIKPSLATTWTSVKTLQTNDKLNVACTIWVTLNYCINANLVELLKGNYIESRQICKFHDINDDKNK